MVRCIGVEITTYHQQQEVMKVCSPQKQDMKRWTSKECWEGCSDTSVEECTQAPLQVEGPKRERSVSELVS